MAKKLPEGIQEYIKLETDYELNKMNRLFNIPTQTIKNKIKVNSGRVELIDHLTIKEKDGIYTGYLKNLNIQNVEIDENLYKKYEKDFSNHGLFGRFFLESNLHDKLLFYISEDSFEPLEYINVKIKDLKKYFKGKSIKKRMNIVLATLGYDANSLLFWQKIFILIRAITFCEKSFHLLELGGKLVGKSTIYTMFPNLQNLFNKSPTIPEFFFNRQTSEDGEVIKNSVLVFDEVREISFKDDFIPMIQNYMEEKRQNSDKELKVGHRSIPFGTSIVFMGNITDPINKMKHNIHLNEEIKSNFLTAPFLDRLNFFIPSWGLVEHNDSMKLKPRQKKIPLNLFTKYLVELRELDLVDDVTEELDLDNLNSRDKVVISQTISGFIKLLNQGDVEGISELEFDAYEAIARKGRHLLITQMELTSDKKKKKDISDIDYSDELVDFILKTEFGSRDFCNKEILPNRIKFDEDLDEDDEDNYENYEDNYLALDSLGLEKNKNLEVNKEDYNFKTSFISEDSMSLKRIIANSYVNLSELNKDYLFNEGNNIYSKSVPFDNIKKIRNLKDDIVDTSLLYSYKNGRPPKFIEYECSKCNCKRFNLLQPFKELNYLDPSYCCNNDECLHELDRSSIFELLLKGKHIQLIKDFEKVKKLKK